MKQCGGLTCEVNRSQQKMTKVGRWKGATCIKTHHEKSFVPRSVIVNILFSVWTRQIWGKHGKKLMCLMKTWNVNSKSFQLGGVINAFWGLKSHEVTNSETKIPGSYYKFGHHEDLKGEKRFLDLEIANRNVECTGGHVSRQNHRETGSPVITGQDYENRTASKQYVNRKNWKVEFPGNYDLCKKTSGVVSRSINQVRTQTENLT